MTPAGARAIVVEYRFRCFCGAPIVTTEKTVTCASCGETLGYYASTLPVRRIEKHKQRLVNLSYTGSLGRTTPTPYAVPYQTLTSIDSDFEDHPDDGQHGGFILFLLPPLIALIVLLSRSCVGI
jgi:hypothetical protein